jgi:hypothetical protein
MAETVDPNYAPYAPYKNVQAVISRYRDRGLPEQLTAAEVERLGISGGMAPRTLRALRFLGLIDEGGNRLEPFERLKRASTEEYPAQLAEIVRAAYLPVFQIVDPAQDSDTAIADAFRRFEPSAQRDKMLALFRGLIEAAEIVQPGKPKSREGGARRAEPTRVKPAALKSNPKPADVDLAGGGAETLPDYRLIQAVIQQLPREPRWIEAKRDRWIKALVAAVDLVFEVEDAEGQ